METAPLIHEKEPQELFDVLAAVTYLNECKKLGDEKAEAEAFERLKLEELSQMAEGLETYLKTEFVYEFDAEHGKVVGFNGEPIISITEKAVSRAESLIEKPGFDFIKPQLDRYRAEHAEQLFIDSMMRQEIDGDTVITFSPYPFNIQQEFGNDTARDLGYEPKTKRSMVRVYRREMSESGGLQLRAVTISLEHSDFSLMRQLATDFGLEQNELSSEVDFLEQPILFSSQEKPVDISSAIAARYDELRFQATGEHTFHGLDAKASNSWDTVQRYGDIIERHLTNLRELSQSMEHGQPTQNMSFMLRNWADVKAEEANGERVYLLKTSQRAKLRGAVYDSVFDNETAKLVKELMTYSAWATMKTRLEAGDTAWRSRRESSKVVREMMTSGMEQAQLSEAMVGCGGAIRFDQEGKDGYSLFDALFGAQNRLEAIYSFNRYMYCVACQRPPKQDKETGRVIEKKKMCGPCGLCRSCDKKLSI